MVRIRLHVETQFDFHEDIVEIPDDEWGAMTAKEKEVVCLDMAVDMQNDIAPCGWEILDETKENGDE
jgi:hypothetical protein